MAALVVRFDFTLPVPASTATTFPARLDGAGSIAQPTGAGSIARTSGAGRVGGINGGGRIR